MQISYENRKLQELCENEAVAKRRLGGVGAKKLALRLADLADAANVRELCAGRPHPLRGDLKGLFALDLAGKDRLLMQSDHDPVPKKKDGGINWRKVTKVIITEIGGYHG